MSVEYKDYYKILGVTRSSPADEIKSAYRKLARKYHPDMHPDAKKAEMSEKFKDINEAYDVLSDSKKKSMYDQLGPDWDKAGGPAYSNAQGGPQGFGGQQYGYSAGGNNFSGFSDFFNSIFGGAGGFSAANGSPFDFGGEYPGAQNGYSGSNLDVEAELSLPLREAFTGGQKRLTVPFTSAAGGRRTRSTKTVTAKLPGGINDGGTIRLKGQGSEQNGKTGDLFIKIKLLPDPKFRLDGLDLETTVNVMPWTAALGGEVNVETLDGSLRIKVPEHTQSGKKLKLRGHGYGKPNGARGDLYAVIAIANPAHLTPEQKALYAKLAQTE